MNSLEGIGWKNNYASFRINEIEYEKREIEWRTKRTIREILKWEISWMEEDRECDYYRIRYFWIFVISVLDTLDEDERNTKRLSASE